MSDTDRLPLSAAPEGGGASTGTTPNVPVTAPKAAAPKTAAKKARKRPAARQGSSQDSRRLRHVELMLEITRKMAAMDSLDEVLYALVDLTTKEIEIGRAHV